VFKRTTIILSAAILVVGGFSAPIFAQNATAQTSSGTYLHTPGALKWQSSGNDKTMKIVEAATPSGRAINARMKKRKKKAWDVALWVEMDGAVKKGDQVQMEFWARTAKAPKSKELAEFIVFVGRNEEPYNNIIYEDFSPEKEWKMYTLTGTAKADFSAERLKVEYQLGKQAQTVEFGDMHVKNMGPAPE